ncbi:MAG: hypothetical protein LBG42_06540 [Treponema sp.]|nr:hypothetical protein [Treponema sp.]
MIYRVFRLVFFLCFSGGMAFAQTGSALLVRGNAWVSGLPGIGENAFPCFFGEYRPAGASADAVFSVYICREPLLFSQRLWQPRQGLPERGAVERREGGTLFVGFPPESSLSGEDHGGWTVLFCFPSEGFDDGTLNRFAAKWLERFHYFFSLVRHIADISFPAVVRF